MNLAFVKKLQNFTNFPAIICTISILSDIEENIQIKMTNETDIKCDICCKSLSGADSLVYHLQTIHGNAKLECLSEHVRITHESKSNGRSISTFY